METDGKRTFAMRFGALPGKWAACFVMDWQGKARRLAVCIGMSLFGFLFFPGAGLSVQAGEAALEAVFVQMPGFVLEQWNEPRLLSINTKGYVRELPDRKLSGFGAVTKGQYVNAWGQTDTGWYLIEYAGRLGYVRYEAGAFTNLPEEIQKQQVLTLQEQQAQQVQVLQEQQALAAAQALQEQEALAAAQALQQAAIQAQALAQQPAVAAGVVFIGDSRMVTLKEAVERNLGACPATVIAKNGSRHEWFHDTAIPQADKIIGKGSKVVINMGVNDLSYADQYAQDLNYWAAVWSARGAQVFYASVNPVWANSHNMTEERVELFNTKLRAQLIPQITWLDSHTYLLQSGVHSGDGIHYKDDTNLILFQYYMMMIGAI